jgi:hypothetical protein
VAHAFNPSYSGGRDQENHGPKPARANRSRDPISKIPITKRVFKVKTLISSPTTAKEKKRKLSPNNLL